MRDTGDNDRDRKFTMFAQDTCNPLQDVLQRPSASSVKLGILYSTKTL